MASQSDETAAGTRRTASVLDRLFDVVLARRDERPDGSYVVSLLDGGWEAIEAKVREEAQEVVDAARDESDEALAHEAADLIFHLWVMLASRGLGPDAVYAELESRFGIGGLEEKASRTVTTKQSREDDEA
jgi:phosphoribosyl-ATP pyrophosphohydrolase